MLGSSDSEVETAPQRQGAPSGSQVLKKRKHGEAAGPEGTESAVKKHKKHRTPEEIKQRELKKAKKNKEKAKTKP